MRLSWLEAVCVVAIAVATLQLQARDPDTRLFVPPHFAALKAALPMRLTQSDPVFPERNRR